MSELARRVLRVVIVLLLAGLLFFQAVLIPLLGVDIAEGGDAVVHLRWPVVVIGILGVATVEVVLVCIWQLLTMVRADTVFSRSAFRSPISDGWSPRRGSPRNMPTGRLRCWNRGVGATSTLNPKCAILPNSADKDW